MTEKQIAEIIRNGRRCGNTTRQVDIWVQELFDTGEAYVVDHAHRSERGVPLNVANKYALNILFRRLYNEHALDKTDYTYNRTTNIVKLKNKNQ